MYLENGQISDAHTPGMVVWCYDRKELGKVVHTATLGLPLAPTVETVSGAKVMYCGKNESNICQYIPTIVSVMTENGYSSNDVNEVREKWYTKTKDQRCALFSQLTDTKGSANDKIESLRQLL